MPVRIRREGNGFKVSFDRMVGAIKAADIPEVSTALEHYYSPGTRHFSHTNEGCPLCRSLMKKRQEKSS